MKARQPISLMAVATLCGLLSLTFTADLALAQAADSQGGATNQSGATGSQNAGLPTLPGSPVTESSEAAGSTKTRPAFWVLPQFAPGSTDQSRPFADMLDYEYDKWLAIKKGVSDQANLDLSIDYSFFPQWGTKSNPVYANVYYPSGAFRPFTDTSIGSGEIYVTTSHQVYFSKQNTGTQASSLGLITFPNDWTRDNFYWSTLTYQHTLPRDFQPLSVTVGEYNLYDFDPSEYAANAQTSFISYSFAQDATQTFPNAGLGGYVGVKAPNGQFNFAGGVQGATDLNGGKLTTEGFNTGKLVRWGNFQWTPTIPDVGDGIYSLLVYEQPFVPNVSSTSTGISFSASQALTKKWGAFIRVNNATGPDIPIRTSYAAGGVWNNPIGPNSSGQAGLALGWNRTNKSDQQAAAVPGARDGEWVSELFYKATIFKGMQLTPDVQVFWNPELAPRSGPEVVFTLRTSLFF